MTQYNKSLGEGFSSGQIGAALNYNPEDSYGGQKIGGLFAEGIRLKNGVYQSTYTQSATQNYYLGSRRVTIDGRVFRYSRCSANRTSAQAVFFNATKFATIGTDGGVVLPTAIVAGDDHCHCTIAATDGSAQGEYEAADGAVAVDELYGGYLYVYGTNSGVTYERENRLIIGNTALAAGGGIIDVDVEEPFTYAQSASIKVEIWSNPWRTLAPIAEDYTSCAGFPACGTVTSGYYFWCQTWGACRISGQNYNLGKTAGERNLWFGPDGSIRSTQIQGATNCRQLAGFVLPRTSASMGETMMMLQISI